MEGRLAWSRFSDAGRRPRPRLSGQLGRAKIDSKMGFVILLMNKAIQMDTTRREAARV